MGGASCYASFDLHPFCSPSPAAEAQVSNLARQRNGAYYNIYLSLYMHGNQGTHKMYMKVNEEYCSLCYGEVKYLQTIH